jgi:hypothetical protein
MQAVTKVTLGKKIQILWQARVNNAAIAQSELGQNLF